MTTGTKIRASDRHGEPDPAAFERFCRTIVPGCLTEVCHVDAVLAARVGEDMLARAESYTALERATQDVLVAPFIEEVVDYEPLDAPLPLKGAVAVVVRNSLLEAAHANDGTVEGGGIKGITSMAAAPLSHLLAVRGLKPARVKFNVFADLADTYPRASACLGAVALAYQAGGGRFPYRTPQAPVPDLPVAEVGTPQGDDPEKERVYSFVLSGIDTRFADQEVELLRKLVEPGDDHAVCFTSSLSRLTRHLGKLMRIMEYLLAHDVPILTTNYLLRPNDVWVRRGDLVPADRDNLLAAWQDSRGLAGAHRATVAKVAKLMDAQELINNE